MLGFTTDYFGKRIVFELAYPFCYLVDGANVGGLKRTVEYFTPMANKCPRGGSHHSWRECSKKSAQQGRSHFDARSVLSVREHGKMARTPLAAFFNIP